MGFIWLGTKTEPLSFIEGGEFLDGWLLSFQELLYCMEYVP